MDFLPDLSFTINPNEICRHLGFSSHTAVDPATKRLIDECCELLMKTVHPRGIYRTDRLLTDRSKEIPELIMAEGLVHIRGSRNLADNLDGCTGVTLVAATLGPQADRLIARAEKQSMAKACVLQACAASMIESWLEAQNQNLANRFEQEGFRLHPRFSPGYGDLPLNCQQSVLNALDAGKYLGLQCLTGSDLMTPMKSITALIGHEPK